MKPNQSKSPHSQFKVIIPIDMKPYPNNCEEKVACILAHKFQSDILFVPPVNSLHTPDLQIINTKEFWEIKNIRGNGKNTIEDNLKKAARQSNNIVVSLFQSKMTPTQAMARIRHFLGRPHRNIKQVLLITKNNKVIDFRG